MIRLLAADCTNRVDPMNIAHDNDPSKHAALDSGVVAVTDYSCVYARHLFRAGLPSLSPTPNGNERTRFSILFVPDPELLGAARKRFLKAAARIQYPDFELVVLDEAAEGFGFDASRKVLQRDFVWFASGAQVPDPDIFDRLDRFIRQEASPDLVYFDSDVVDTVGRHVNPSFRYGWSESLFLAGDYIGEACVIRAGMVDAESLNNRMDPATYGAQRSRIIAKSIESGARVRGLPEVLVHSQYPVTVTLKAATLKAATTVTAVELDKNPLVSILIPFRDEVDVLKRCIDSIRTKSSYRPYELILISNGSKEPATLQYIETLSRQSDDVQVLHIDEPFNFSRLNNQGVNIARGEYLLFLNNDTEVITEAWIEHLLGAAGEAKVGAVGCKLLYPDHSIQHAGIILGGGSWDGKDHGVASLMYRGFVPGVDYDAMGVLDRRRDVEAVTAACMLVRKIDFLQVDGFDEEHLSVDFNDVDLCLRLQETGLRILYEPSATLTHYESYSRRASKSALDVRRFAQQVEYMFARHGRRLEHDRYFNINMSRSQGETYLNVVKTKDGTILRGNRIVNGRSRRVAILIIRHKPGFGVGVVVHAQAIALIEAGWKVTVYAMEYEPGFHEKPPYKVVIVPQPTPFFIGHLKYAGFDCVIAHTTPFFEILASLSPFTTAIAYEHGDPTPSLFGAAEVHIRQQIKDYKRKFVYPNVDRVIAISRFIAQDIGWLDATIIHNGADHLETASSGLTERDVQLFLEKFGLTGGEKLTRILAVCRLGPGEKNYKGLDNFVRFKKLFKDHENYEFWVLGKGCESDKEELEREGVKVILNASDRELALAYMACDHFVSFSKWEGFNLPLVEAQYFGKPAFALDVCSHPEVTLQSFHSLKAVAVKIQSMNREQTHALGESCREFASQFTWKNNVSRLVEITEATIQAAAPTKQVVRGRSFSRPFSNLMLEIFKIVHRTPMLNRLAYFPIAAAYRIKRSFRLRKSAEDTPGGGDPHARVMLPLSRNREYVEGLASICILSKDHMDLIRPCIESILEHSKDHAFEVLIGDTGSSDKDVLAFYEGLPDPVRVEFLGFYNFSASNNQVSRRASGEFLLFLNNDTEVLPGWLDGLQKPFRFENVAITGSKMLFRDSSIQHAGVEIFTKEPYRYVGWHPYSKFPRDYPETCFAKDVPAVTGACMMIRHALFDEIGGFDEAYVEECQDADLCLEVRRLKHRIVYTPDSCIYHYEGGTRTTRESQPDRDRFRARWQRFIDEAILSQATQSRKWIPELCLTAKADDVRTKELLALVSCLAKDFPELSVTVKAERLEDARVLAARIEARAVRWITVDYEDSRIYDLEL